ncbi:response regulator [Marinobacterium aestuariivivens]|uniref:Response regulator n=1 Tax=Marinobacterium aestuariivivens TaxID=1698799 RepID=A0ABW1ZXM6_9GAMM
MPDQATAAVELEAIDFAPATLLVVDDIAVNRDLIKGYLARYPFRLLEAENGQEAVATARRHQPDLVLMDMRMPLMNGYEATRQLKQDDSTRAIPVIALTASAMEQDAREIGLICDGYLRKPVSQQALVIQLGRFLVHSVVAETPAPEETRPWPDKALNDTQKQRLTELLPRLRALQSDCDTLCRTMSINDIEAFAQQMRTLASDYDYPPLEAWGRQLAEQSGLFDLDGITATLNSFGEQCRALEARLKEQPPGPPARDG